VLHQAPGGFLRGEASRRIDLQLARRGCGVERMPPPQNMPFAIRPTPVLVSAEGARPSCGMNL
jgi:hypothetical protein